MSVHQVPGDASRRDRRGEGGLLSTGAQLPDCRRMPASRRSPCFTSTSMRPMASPRRPIEGCGRPPHSPWPPGRLPAGLLRVPSTRSAQPYGTLTGCLFDVCSPARTALPADPEAGRRGNPGGDLAWLRHRGTCARCRPSRLEQRACRICELAGAWGLAALVAGRTGLRCPRRRRSLTRWYGRSSPRSISSSPCMLRRRLIEG